MPKTKKFNGRKRYIYAAAISTCEKEKTGFVDPVNLRSNITVKSFLLCKNKSGGNNNKNN
jgi:hypothetical protein